MIIMDEYVVVEPVGCALCINEPDNIASTPDFVCDESYDSFSNANMELADDIYVLGSR